MLTKQEIKKKLLDTKLFNDDEYLDKYCNLCAELKQEPLYVEWHHIFPKSLSIFLNQKIDNSNNNLIKLNYRDHIRAHIFLALACMDNEMFFKFEYAAKICLHENSKNIKKIEGLRERLKNNLIKIKEFSLLKEKKYEIDKTFYDECNKCKSLAEHDKKFNHKKTYSAIRYINSCKRYGWENRFPQAWTEFEDKEFYDECNKCKSLAEHDKKFKLLYGYSQGRYKRICNEYGYKNMFKHAWTKEEDKEFYDECNECRSLGEHDKLFNLRLGYSRTRYYRIIHRHKWKSMFVNKHFKPDKFSFAQNKEFYDECNKCKTLAEHDRKFGFNKDYSKTRYRIICNKYNWINRFSKKERNK